MRSVSTALQRSTRGCQCGSCSRCALPPSGCYEGQYYAEASIEITFPIILNIPNGPFCGEYNTSGSASSCISYLDAYNKAKMKAYKAAYELALEENCIASLTSISSMIENGYSNDELTISFDCPCGWTGGPIEKTVAAGTFTGYSRAQANNTAWLSMDPYDTTPEGCVPPT